LADGHFRGDALLPRLPRRFKNRISSRDQTVVDILPGLFRIRISRQVNDGIRARHRPQYRVTVGYVRRDRVFYLGNGFKIQAAEAIVTG